MTTLPERVRSPSEIPSCGAPAALTVLDAVVSGRSAPTAICAAESSEAAAACAAVALVESAEVRSEAMLVFCVFCFCFLFLW